MPNNRTQEGEGISSQRSQTPLGARQGRKLTEICKKLSQILVAIRKLTVTIKETQPSGNSDGNYSFNPAMKEVTNALTTMTKHFTQNNHKTAICQHQGRHV